MEGTSLSSMLLAEEEGWARALPCRVLVLGSGVPLSFFPWAWACFHHRVVTITTRRRGGGKGRERTRQGQGVVSSFSALATRACPNHCHCHRVVQEREVREGGEGTCQSRLSIEREREKGKGKASSSSSCRHVVSSCHVVLILILVSLPWRDGKREGKVRAHYPHPSRVFALLLQLCHCHAVLSERVSGARVRCRVIIDAILMPRPVSR